VHRLMADTIGPVASITISTMIDHIMVEMDITN
jgi:hypothetical protein